MSSLTWMDYCWVRTVNGVSGHLLVCAFVKCIVFHSAFRLGTLLLSGDEQHRSEVRQGVYLGNES